MEQPRRIGDYEILTKLGAGGMGEVYKVRNVLSDRIEAMKVLLPDLAGREDLAARFLREIKVLAALDHPNIAALRTALTAGNQLVMIMEFVEGQPLSKRLARGPVPMADAIHYVNQVLGALEYAHRQQVIHRDIKPANMMLMPTGVVKLTDFGIARSANEPALTVAGATTGSLSYMSPEQIKGLPTDARSDLYSLGVSLYEMLTGRVPFKADTGFAVMLAHLNEPPTPPAEIQPSLSAELNRVVLKAMAKEPAERFQSAMELRAALKALSFPAVHAGTEFDPTLAAATVPHVPSPHVAPPVVAVPVPAVPAATAAPPPLPPPVPPAAPVLAASAAPAPPPAAAPVSAASAAAPPLPAPAKPPAPASASQADPWMAHARKRRVSPILYVALGALLVVGGIAGMAYYSRLAEANPPAASTAPTPPPATAAPAAEPAAEPAATEAPLAVASPEPAPSTPAPTSDSAATALPGTSPATTSPATTTPAAAARVRDADTPPVERAGRPSRPARPVEEASQSPAPARSERATAQPAPAEPAAPVPAQPAASDDAALEELGDELDRMSIRAATVNDSLDRLKQAQARMGLGLRGETAARQHSMNLNFSRAEEAVARRDLARARRYKAQAEEDLKELEKFLGR